MSDFSERAAGIGALADPVRRELYLFVCAQDHPVARDEAADALDLPLHKVKFHLDRLAGDGLLDVEFARLSGRTGPGAGRPSKLYRRSDREVAVTLPGRRYDLAGRLLAAALDEAEASGDRPRTVLERRARDTGREIGAQSRAAHPAEDARAVVVNALEENGFEPRAEGLEIVLANCPFHALADEHTALVCGMNLQLLDGLVDEVDDARLRARLDPLDGRCCVVLGPAETTG